LKGVWIVLVIASILFLSIGLSQDSFAACNVCGDFNNDGYDDLVISVQAEDLGLGSENGAVNVIYGSASGLHRSLGHADQFWHQDSPGIADTAESSDHFAISSIIGDFNNDGYDDLVIGVQREDLSGSQEGAVHVIYGSASGLSASATRSDQFWHQDSKGIADTAENFDSFGNSLTVGDFNNDGFDDLAVGVFGEDLSGSAEGAIHVIYGSASGLHRSLTRGDQFWHQDSKGIADTAETGDNFGSTLTTGDFNNDMFDDLAIGVPRESLSGTREGAVNVIYGSASGLHRSLTRGDQFWTQDSKGIADTAEGFDEFGATLSAGDFNNDGFDDLAVGVPTESHTSFQAEGAVNVIYGSASGLHRSLTRGDQFWTQESTGIADTAEDSDQFGSSLTIGDFNNDGFDDLAIGVTSEDLSGSNEGAVNVIYGSASGLHRSLGRADQFWTQDSTGIADTAENGDRFGESLHAADFNNDGFDDLAIGLGFEDLSGNNEGAVNVIYGSASGLHRSLTRGDQFWHQDSKGIADTAEDFDCFGTNLPGSTSIIFCAD